MVSHRLLPRRSAAVCALGTAVALALLWLIVPSAFAAPTTPTPAPATTRLDWQACRDLPAGTPLRCTTLEVPVDWEAPIATERTTIGLALLPAVDPDRRIGSVVVNLGGPLSSIDVVAQAPEQFAELSERFDVVVMDPRGIGHSDGVVCPPAPTQARLLADTSARAWYAFARDNARWEQHCRAAAGPLADHLDARQVAHDLDAVRGALGEPRLRYLGNSYGTVYGQEYARLFGDRIETMVLDSVAAHLDPDPLVRTAPMAAIHQDRFDRFAEWCAATPECGLDGDPRELWDELMQRATRAPLPASDGAPVTADELRYRTLLGLDRSERWTGFAQSLARAAAGDARDVRAPSAPDTDTTVGRLAFCADFGFRGSYRDLDRLEQRLRGADPRTGWLSARTWYGRCAGLSHQDGNPPRPLTTTTTAPVLIVSGTDDDTTPPELGAAVAGRFGNGRQLRVDSGHAVYLSGDPCARPAVHTALIGGGLPAAGATCPAG